jgi:hypothetical protein
MNRSDLQSLSRIRQREARTLLSPREFAGAYYLAGYAVECALKACIAKQTRRYDFPERDVAQKAHAHDLEALWMLGKLKQDFTSALATDPSLKLDWTVVKDWKPSARYQLAVGEAAARALFSAATQREHGVLPWIRARW